MPLANQVPNQHLLILLALRPRLCPRECLLRLALRLCPPVLLLSPDLLRLELDIVRELVLDIESGCIDARRVCSRTGLCRRRVCRVAARRPCVGVGGRWRLEVAVWRRVERCRPGGCGRRDGEDAGVGVCDGVCVTDLGGSGKCKSGRVRTPWPSLSMRGYVGSTSRVLRPTKTTAREMMVGGRTLDWALCGNTSSAEGGEGYLPCRAPHSLAATAVAVPLQQARARRDPGRHGRSW